MSNRFKTTPTRVCTTPASISYASRSASLVVDPALATSTVVCIRELSIFASATASKGGESTTTVSYRPNKYSIMSRKRVDSRISIGLGARAPQGIKSRPGTGVA